MNISLPVLLLILTIVSFVWLAIVFSKKIISTSTTIKWLSANVVSIVLFLYLLVIGLIEKFNPNFDYHKYNFLQWIMVNFFGSQSEISWVILVLFFVVTITSCVSIRVIIRLNQQHRRINDLNRDLAILKGKVAMEMNQLNFDTSELSVEELKYLLEEQLAKEKLKAKYKNKLSRISKSSDVDITIDTKTLLNINNNNNEQEKDNKNNNGIE